jgi:hypothetical protein
MKDLSHHRAHLQKKVIKDAKSSPIALSEKKPLKFRFDHEMPYWEPKSELEQQKKAEKEASRDALRLNRVAKARKERKVLQY